MSELVSVLCVGTAAGNNVFYMSSALSAAAAAAFWLAATCHHSLLSFHPPSCSIGFHRVADRIHVQTDGGSDFLHTITLF